MSSSQGVLVGMVALSLGVTTYVAVTMPSAPTERRTPGGEPAASPDTNSTAESIAELRAEILTLGERMDQRLAALEARLTTREITSGEALAVDESGQPTFATADQQTDALAARVAENVQEQLDAKLERMASRQRNLNMGGEWKAPIGDLAEELDLTEEQKETATTIFDDARDTVFDMLKAEREDGGSLVDDLVTNLREGKADALPTFMQQILSQKVPGEDRTYFASMIALTEEVRTDLSSHLSEEQMDKLGTLNVALLEVETGYDPVGEYVRTEAAQ